MNYFLGEGTRELRGDLDGVLELEAAAGEKERARES
jgi:hypothetical protein